MKRKIALFFSLILAAAILLTGTAGAEWRKENVSHYDRKTGALEDYTAWRYYEDGKKVQSFKGKKSVEIPEEVDSLDRASLNDLGRDFVLVVKEGSYAETFAKEHGYQYDNGTKRVVGYDIDDLEEKAQWVIDNYITDNYKGTELTDAEKARVLHDWLTTNATYDYYDLELDDQIKEREQNGQPADDLEAIREDPYFTDAVLVRGKGVCNSFSQAYSLLLYKVGVENRYLIGDTGGDLSSLNHAWNLVLIDGQWYHVDVTWDNSDGVTMDSGLEDMVVTTENDDADYVHFLTTDEGIKAWSTYRAWDRDVSADDNTAGFIFTADGTYYYGTPGETAARTTGWVDYAYSTEDQNIGATILYDPKTDTRLYQPNGKYYFDEATGKMTVGWKKIDGKNYYFREMGNMATGWVEDNGSKYHMSDSGAADTGWQTLVSPDFLIWSDEANKYVDAYVKYYFGTDGRMATGWKKIGSSTYYFGDKGNMATGWVDDGGDRYHMAEDGTMDTGMKKLKTGYLIRYTSDGEWEDAYAFYYFGTDGKMAKGLKEIEGSTYYFNEENGEMLKNKSQELNLNGKTRKYYFNQLGHMEHPGDVDGNEQINGADAVRLMKYLADRRTEVNEVTADVDGNGVTNGQDMQRMMDYFAGNIDSLD